MEVLTLIAIIILISLIGVILVAVWKNKFLRKTFFNEAIGNNQSEVKSILDEINSAKHIDQNSKDGINNLIDKLKN